MGRLLVLKRRKGKSQQILRDINREEKELHSDHVTLVLSLFIILFVGSLWMTRTVCIYLLESSPWKKNRTDMFSQNLSWCSTISIRRNEKYLLHTNMTIRGQVQIPSAHPNSKNTTEKEFQIHLQLLPSYTPPCPYHVQNHHCLQEKRKRRSKKLET